MEPAIDLERFAALSAELDAGVGREELCAREGITVDTWTATQAAWLAKLADESSRKRFALTNRYNNAFVARRSALTHGGPSPSRRARPEPAKPVTPAAPVEPPVVAPPPIAMPSGLAAAAGGIAPPAFAPPPYDAPPPRLDAPAFVRDMGAPPAMIAPPPVIAAPPVITMGPQASPNPRPAEPASIARDEDGLTTEPIPPIAAPPPMVATPSKRAATVALPMMTEPITAATLPFAPKKDDLNATAAVGLMSPFATGAAALPFKGAAPGAPPAPPPPAPPPPSLTEDAGSTTASGPSPLAASRAALPFAAPAAVKPQAAPAQPSKPRASTPPPAPPPAPAKVDPGEATVFGAISPFAQGAAALPFAPTAPAGARQPLAQSSMGLPFQPSARGAGEPSQVAASPVAKPPQPPPARPAGEPSQVTASPAPAGSPAARPSPSSPATGPRLTLEQFASLTAEVAVYPRSAAQIRARYGLDEAAHRAEAEAHNARFNADPALYTHYMQLFQSFRDYVARSQR